MASATLEDRPSPSQTMKMEPRTIRGIEFMTWMYGPKIFDSIGTRPKAIPQTMPATTPMAKPSSASSIVTPTWVQIEPASVPFFSQSPICTAILLGWPKKNGSSTFSWLSSSQPPTKTTNTVSCSTRTRVFWRRARARARGSATSTDSASAGSAGVGGAVSCDMGGFLLGGGGGGGGAGVGELHLIAQRLP